MTLKEYFKQKHGFEYPARWGEADAIWQPRLYDTMAEYIDYRLDERLKSHESKIPVV